MPKQMLIYETAVALSSDRHADLFLEPRDDYAFSASADAVPLMAAEFLLAAAEYAIVFTRAGDDVLPVTVLGVKDDGNLYLAPGAGWQARYIPAFIRRYPFVFAASEDGNTLTLCIDETHPGFNRAGLGQRVFGEDGKPSEFTQQILAFLQQYHAHYERTKRFGAHLQALGVLEAMQATVTTPQGEQLPIGNFLAVSRDKLRALDGPALARLAAADELELLYLHLYSMRNFNEVKDRLIAARAQAQPVTEPVAEAVEAS